MNLLPVEVWPNVISSVVVAVINGGTDNGSA